MVLDRFELDLSILQRRGMFSRLVQAVHQFIILTEASSSHRLLANCGCTKKSRVAPSITRAGWLLVESAPPQLPGVTLQSIELRGKLTQKLAAQLPTPTIAALSSNGTGLQ